MLDKATLPTKCFHCGDKVPQNSNWQVLWKGIQRPMCCPGCEAVCETIIESGLEEYYLHRENKPLKPEVLIPDELKRLAAFNQPEISAVFTQFEENKQQATFYIEGMTCAACAWLIEKKVSKLAFVDNISVNAISNMANICWYSEETNSKTSEKQQNPSSHMGDILSAIQSAGYSAKPLLSEQIAKQHKNYQKDLLKRLGVAGLGMMQVMMFAVGLYSGAFLGIEQKYQTFLTWISWLVATPVVFYSAMPFFRAAFNNLKSFDLGMNVPVSIAIGSAYFTSSYHTFVGKGEVYFDSAVMFTFFLLIGRFLQSRAGWRASETNLSSGLATAPSVQTKVAGEWQYIPTSDVKCGDTILVPAGETIAVDGIITKGVSSISTAIINGEFEPKRFSPGDEVLAASINQSQPIEIRCTAVGIDRFIEKLSKRQQQVLAEKPKIVSLADKLSHWFVLFVLSVAILSAVYWSIYSPQDAFWITLSVLVVSCPCALSLATPAAMTAAIARASKIGFLINKPEFLEQLTHNQWIAFDKTGTLTSGMLSVTEVEVLQKNATKQDILSIAAALESSSVHPIAKAIRNSTTMPIHQQVTQREEIIGKGVLGVIDGNHYSLGHFQNLIDTDLRKHIVVIKNQQLMARIFISDPFREEAKSTISALSKLTYKIAILSGDPSIKKSTLEQNFKVDEVLLAASAEDKLNWVADKQNQSEKVIMIGDGLNDSPVLAQANVSIAMSQGAALSKISSDAVLLNGNLSNLLKLLQLSAKTTKVIRQNLSWAALYNVVTIPLAASGLIAPWLAAIGMSLSSLFVVLNALTLNQKSRGHNG